jgi:hypothetical protein
MPPGSAFARPPSAREIPETQAEPIHPDDVGALAAQALAMREQEPLDDVTRALWNEALSRALTGQASPKPR